MQLDDKNHLRDVPQNIIIENRMKISISGVSDVENFDENTVVLYTNRGLLSVHGTGLSVEKLNLETGELAIEGEFSGLEYSRDTQISGGFWSKLFK